MPPPEGQTSLAPTESAQTLSTRAARTLATTVKTIPQTQAITPRWLLRRLPWVEVKGGTYRVNRRRALSIEDGRVTFTWTGTEAGIGPHGLRAVPVLRDLDEDVLSDVAADFEQRTFAPGETIVQTGSRDDVLVLIVHGRAVSAGRGPYGGECLLGTHVDGSHFGGELFNAPDARWSYDIRAVSRCTILRFSDRAYRRAVDRVEELRRQIESPPGRDRAAAYTSKGEAVIELLSGHRGEPGLPSAFADYDATPPEYDMGVAQTIVRVHNRVADLYSEPMDQTEQQIRLTVEALREEQERQLITDPGFGLLNVVDERQRVQASSGPPTPADLDDLISRRRKTRVLLAHPRAIAAFGRSCNAHGIYPDSVEVDGARVTTWRGVPIFPSDKIPVGASGTTSILALRTGVDDSGVVGLRPENDVEVTRMDVDDTAVTSHLVTVYFSLAVLVPDAFGVLENVQL